MFKYVLLNSKIRIFKEGDILEKKSATLRSAWKVYQLIKLSRKPITPTQISKQTKVAYPTVLCCIEYLKEWDVVSLNSDGRIIFVELKEKRGKDGDIRRFED